MNLYEACTLAERIVAEMRPYCERVEIAGSIRRAKVEVKDIEIVAIPRVERVRREEAPALFMFSEDDDNYESRNVLLEWAKSQTLLQWIKAGKNPDPVEHPRTDNYWRAFVNGTDGQGQDGLRMKLDLFLAKPDNWGMIFLYRTGSNKFNKSWLQYMNQRTIYRADGGYLWEKQQHGGRRMETFEEEDFFRLLDLDWVEPRERADHTAVRKRGRVVGFANW